MNNFSEYPYTNFSDLNIDYILNKLKSLVDDIQRVDDRTHEYDQAIAEIRTLYQSIISGNFPDAVKDAFTNWMLENAVDIVADMVKNVFFGLTDSGYFVAYIPESWSDITFKTSDYDMSVSGVDFGHLILLY